MLGGPIIPYLFGGGNSAVAGPSNGPLRLSLFSKSSANSSTDVYLAVSSVCLHDN